MILLLNHWLDISPAVLSLLLDVVCYAFAFRYVNKDFFVLSIISTISLAVFLKLWGMLNLQLFGLFSHPLIASLTGGIFIGIGVGIVIKNGGSCGGDDALALTISKAFNWRISRAYLSADTAVLLLSLSYIPVKLIAFSMLTVIVSSFLVDLIITR